MRKIVFMLTALILCAVNLFAAGIVPAAPGQSQAFVDFATFTGIVGFVSLIVTQVAKLIPAIEARRWAKILVSILTGVLVTLLAWFLQTTDFLAGLNVWLVLIYGVGIGLSGCGYYDLVKPILDRLTKDSVEINRE